MFTIEAAVSFDAAHYLLNYQGPCSNVHGHRWNVIGRVKCETIDQEGMTVDLKDLKQWLRDIVCQYDHRCLNDHFGTPTAEVLAESIFKQLVKNHQGAGHIESVTVEETPGCSVTFTQS